MSGALRRCTGALQDAGDSSAPAEEAEEGVKRSCTAKRWLSEEDEHASLESTGSR